MKTRILFIAIALIFNSTFFVKGQSNTLKKEKFHFDKASEDEIGYCEAVKVGNTIYISGSVGWGKMDQALKHVYDQLGKILKNYNATFENVVKENLYTLALDSVIKYKDIRKLYYKNDDFPAATWVEVSRLYTPGLVLEIELIAILPDKR
ncbi:MAG: RidA family protein [Bacteroidales bacterium]